MCEMGCWLPEGVINAVDAQEDGQSIAPQWARGRAVERVSRDAAAHRARGRPARSLMEHLGLKLAEPDPLSLPGSAIRATDYGRIQARRSPDHVRGRSSRERKIIDAMHSNGSTAVVLRNEIATSFSALRSARLPADVDLSVPKTKTSFPSQYERIHPSRCHLPDASRARCLWSSICLSFRPLPAPADRGSM